MEALVRYLCSPTCAGRAPGTPEGVAARVRIVDELRAAGASPAGTDEYLQDVPGCGSNLGRLLIPQSHELDGLLALALRPASSTLRRPVKSLPRRPHSESKFGAGSNR
jgi:hypothetical protein